MATQLPSSVRTTFFVTALFLRGFAAPSQAQASIWEEPPPAAAPQPDLTPSSPSASASTRRETAQDAPADALLEAALCSWLQLVCPEQDSPVFP